MSAAIWRMCLGMKNGLNINRKMTNEEYNKKKRECWDALHKELLDGEVQWQPVSRYEIFSTAFDRAFALGKQTEAIMREDVEKAAEEYAEKAMEHVYSGEWDSEYVQGLIEAAWYDGYTALGKQDASIETINGDVVINL